MYLLDANVLITAHNNYYAIDQVPNTRELGLSRIGGGL